MSNNSDHQFGTDAIPTVAELAAEQVRLKQVELLEELLGKPVKELQADLDEAVSELQRELGVRERCFPNWIAVGKVSRVDARDRFSRMKKALEICTYLLDITGKQVRMSTDDVPF